MTYDTAINQGCVAAFILINLVVGWRAGRHVKTFQDYALANRSLGTGVLTITLIATWLDGGSLLDIYRFYDRGVGCLLYSCFIILSSLLLGWFVFPRLASFKGCYTLGDIMRKVYGNNAALFASLAYAIFSVCMIAFELVVIGKLCGFLDLNRLTLVIIVGLAVTAYTFTGGIRSVTATDIFQFIILTVGIVFMLNKGLNLTQVGGIKNLLKQVKEQKPNHLSFLNHDFSLYSLITSLFTGGLFPAFLLAPPVIQRILMTHNKKQTSRMFTGFSVFYMLFNVSMLLLGFILLVRKEALEESISRDNVLSHILYLLFTNPWAKIGVLLVFVALVMSSADSYLNALVVLLYNDFGHTLRRRYFSGYNTLQITKIIALCTGMLSTILAASYSPQVLFRASFSLVSAIYLPFILGVLGLKGSPKVFFRYVVTFLETFLLAMLLDICGGISIYRFIKTPSRSALWLSLSNANNISLVVATIMFFVFHYLEFGKLTWTQKAEEKPLTLKRLDNDLSWYHMFTQPFAWASTKISLYQWQPMILGLFLSLFNMLPSLTIQTEDTATFFKLLFVLRIISSILCTGLIFQSQWPKKWKNIYQLLYFITIIYCLPFVNSLLFFYDPHNPVRMLLLMLHILMLIILVDWKTFISFTMIGAGAAWLVYLGSTGNSFPALTFDEGWTLAVGLFFTLLIGLIFARKKQQSYQEWLGHHHYLAKEHAYIGAQFQKAYQFQYDFVHGLNKDGIDVVSYIEDIIQEISSETAKEKLNALKEHFTHVIHEYRDHLRLSIKKITIKDLLKNFEKEARKAHLDMSELFFINKATQKEIHCDTEKITRAFSTMLRDAHEKNVNQDLIYVYIHDAQLGYSFTKFDEHIKKINAIKFIITTDPMLDTDVKLYKGDAKGEQPTAKQIEIPSIEKTRIINAHYGFFDTALPIGINKQLLVLPYNLREIRSKAMDVNEAPTTHEYENDPKVRATEKAFYEKIQEKFPKISRKKIDQAINLIRRYHAHQRRKTGEPYYLHCIETANIVMNMIPIITPNIPTKEVEDILCAALCHDIVEDSSMKLSQLSMLFGSTMASLVSGVSKLDKGVRKKKMSSAENIHQLINEQDKRILMIKIADRKHNMKSIHGHELAKRKKIAEETLNFFVPLASKLGLDDTAKELNERSLDVLNEP